MVIKIMVDLISVIIPVYNVEPYLKKCLDSVVTQTYKEIEIILVDDGSTDGSGLICDEYAAQDKRIKVIRKQNGGLSDARNVGLDQCNGRYVTFIDSDDYVASDYIERLYRILVEYNADIAVCDYFEFYDDEPVQTPEKGEKIIVFDKLQALEQLYGKYSTQMTVACSKLYKTELFKDLRFPVGKVHEDMFMAHRVLYKSNGVVLTTRKLYFYRKRKGSITREGFKVKNRLDNICALKERIEFFEKNKLHHLREKTCASLFSYVLESYVLARKLGKEDKELFFRELAEVYNLSYPCSKPFLRVTMKIAHVIPEFVYGFIRLRRIFRKALYSIKS